MAYGADSQNPFDNSLSLRLNDSKLSVFSSDEEVFYIKAHSTGGTGNQSGENQVYSKHRVYIGSEYPTPFPPTDLLNTSVMLAVNGAVLAKEFYIKSSWSDFVFDPAYKLIPLDQLEKFVTKQRHLPDIPSAEEVKNNSIGMSVITSKLLQKVEELTLYVIDLKKENTELKSRIERMEK